MREKSTPKGISFRGSWIWWSGPCNSKAEEGGIRHGKISGHFGTEDRDRKKEGERAGTAPGRERDPGYRVLLKGEKLEVLPEGCSKACLLPGLCSSCIYRGCYCTVSGIQTYHPADLPFVMSFFCSIREKAKIFRLFLLSADWER